MRLNEIVKENNSQIFNLYKGIANMLKVSGDNLALHTINTHFKSKYEGKADVSVSWKAQDAKKVCICHDTLNNHYLIHDQ